MLLETLCFTCLNLKKIENKHQITEVITNDVNLFKCEPDKN